MIVYHLRFLYSLLRLIWFSFALSAGMCHALKSKIIPRGMPQMKAALSHVLIKAGHFIAL